MAFFRPPALYPIVDVREGDPQCAFRVADAVLAAGAPWLQLRVKDTPARSHLEIARELVERSRRYDAHVIVNDRLDIALLSGAAGVHLGQTDLPLRAARAVGQDLVIGISTHDVDQARAAEDGGADYIGFGPMFSTESKADALTPRASGSLAAVRLAVTLPIVAIGGIEPSSAREVLRSGADSVAMIGALVRANDAGRLAREILGLAPADQSS